MKLLPEHGEACDDKFHACVTTSRWNEVIKLVGISSVASSPAYLSGLLITTSNVNAASYDVDELRATPLDGMIDDILRLLSNSISD